MWALLAIFVCGPIGGILAIIYGGRTVREVDESGGTLGGKGWGRFAQIAGWFSVLVYVVVFIIAGITVASR
ncbi:MAG: hypothetical protein U0Q07_08775 [Acidimicrobiales bacterium]